MPQRPQRPCRHQGCKALHRNANGFCDAHAEDAKAWARTPKSAERRITGRALQARRLRMWSHCPLCAACGRLTDIDPRATWRFELDHIVRLADDGEDTDANCQLLCVSRDEAGVKVGCHAEKTAREGAA
jgi:hypothetical protein